MGQTGKRAGPKRKRSITPALLALCAGVTLCVIAWGYLVKAAIDFGVTARGGRSDAWWFLGLASLGAIACLFIGLMLISRITRRLGITRPPAPVDVEVPPSAVVDPVAPPRAAGGHRR